MQTFIYRFEDGVIHSQKYTLHNHTVKWYENGDIDDYCEMEYQPNEPKENMRMHLWIVTNDKTKIGETNA